VAAHLSDHEGLGLVPDLSTHATAHADFFTFFVPLLFDFEFVGQDKAACDEVETALALLSVREAFGCVRVEARPDLLVLLGKIVNELFVN